MHNKNFTNTLALRFAPLPLAISLATAGLFSSTAQAACTASGGGLSVNCSSRAAANNAGMLFWDGQTASNGAIDGGSGTWDATTSNWTNADGSVNQAWNGGFAIFQGMPGTVQVQGSQHITGLQFLTDGYTLSADTGGVLDFVDTASVQVDTGKTATLNVTLSGTGTLTKEQGGVLVLNGTNTYSGGTTLSGGTLLVGSNQALGSGALTVSGASNLGSTQSVMLNNAIVLNSNLTVSGANDLRLDGPLGGGTNSQLIKTGSGNLTLVDTDHFQGSVVLNGGTLSIASNYGTPGYIGLTATGDSRLAVASVQPLTINTAINKDVTLEFFNNVDVIHRGQISGTGTLAKTGTGELILDQINALEGSLDIREGTLTARGYSSLGYKPNVNVEQGARLNVRESASISNLTGGGEVNVANITVLNIDNNDNTTFSGELTGVGIITKQGTGTLTLSGASSHTGQLMVSGGGLNLTSTGALGSWVSVMSGATLGGAGTVAGSVSISNDGHLAVSSGNVLTTGALTLGSNSNLDARLGASVPNAAGLVKVNGSLTLDGKLNITDIGGFGMGVYRLIDYTGALTDNGLALGQLPFGIEADDMEVQTSIDKQVNLIVNSSGSSLAFWNGSKTSADGSIAGGSGVWGASTNWTDSTGGASTTWGDQFAVFGGQSGTVTVDGAQAFAGLQFISDGYRIVGAGSDNLSAINAADGSLAVVRVDAGMTAFIDAPLVGSGGIQKLDTGTLVLGGQNTYMGGTIITGGTLVGNTTSLQGDILNNANLVFQQGEDGLFSGALSGTGAAFKRGAGTLMLTGNHAYNGNFLIEEGVLQIGETVASAPAPAASFARAFNPMAVASVGDSLNANVTVAQGAGLSGSGTVAGLLNHGEVLPGPNGNLSVAGNFTNASDGTLSIALTPSSTSYLSVGGGAILAGRLNVLSMAPYTGDTTYTLLTAGSGILGVFDQTNLGEGGSQAFIDTALHYTGNALTLSVARNDVAFADVAVTGNQRRVAAALDSAAAPASLRSEITSLDRTSAVAAFDNLSGEIHASTASVLLEDSRYLRNALTDRMRQPDCGNDDPRSVLAPSSAQQSSAGCQDQGVGWISALGGWSTHDASHAAASVDRDLSGFMLGYDNALNEDWRAGIAAGYTHTSLDAKQRNSDASVDSYHLASYLSYQADALSARLGAGYSWHRIDTKRHVMAGGYSDELKAKYKAGTAQVFGEVGYAIQAAGVALEPFAGLAYVNYDSENGREKGGAGRLRASAEQDVAFSTVGLRVGKALTLGNGTTVTPRGSLGWRHAFGDTTPDADLRFIDGGAGFSTQGVPIAKDAAVVEAGFDVNVGQAGKLGLGYSGQLSSENRDHAIMASFSLGF